MQTDLEDPEYLGRTTQPSTEALIVNNKALAPLMARAVSIVPRNSAIPVLGHVLMVSSPTQLTITANNMEMAIRQSCAAHGPQRSFCVEAASLNALLQRLPADADIRFEFDDRHASLRAGPVRAKLAMLSVDDYPAFRDLTYAADIEINGAELRTALNRTRPFVASEETRYYLTGVHMRPGNDRIRLEGTDGKCVGMSELEAASLPPMILPGRAVDEVLKIIGEGPVRVRGSAVAAEFQSGGVMFMTKLVDATFPDLDRVLQQQSVVASESRVWRVNRDAMLRVIAMASATGSSASIGEFLLSEEGSRIRVEERDDKLKRDDEVVVDLDDATCSFTGTACEFRIRLSELIAIIKAAGPVSEFRPNAELTWFRISDISDPRATFIVGSYR